MDNSAQEQFAAHAEALRLNGEHHEALVTLMRGLSKSPGDHPARLLLARVLFELDCAPFALNELKILCQTFPRNESLQKLYLAMGGAPIAASSSAASEVLAESEIDFDAIEELGQE